MSVSHPGVYVAEMPIADRPIEGVPTAITAFVGRAERGSEEPTAVGSLAEFERLFGHVDETCPMACAVRDFFANGGTQAVVLRLFNPPAGAAAAAAHAATLARGRFKLVAASRGSWANTLRIRIDSTVSPDVAASFGLDTTDLFNLTVVDTVAGTLETFAHLTVKESPRRADRVLAAESTLLRVASKLPAKVVPRSHADTPRAGKTLWNDSTTSAGVTAAGRAGDSAPLDIAAWLGDSTVDSGLFALRRTDLFNLLCLPPDTVEGDTPVAVLGAALDFCVERRAMLIVDAPAAWAGAADIFTDNHAALDALGLNGTRGRNAALYFPRIVTYVTPPGAAPRHAVPCGAVAGVIARTDRERGVWKAPSGITASLRSVQALAGDLNDGENGRLNPIGVNCLRRFPGSGNVVWGARTLAGADALADEFKYIPVRRLALYIEESLFRGLQWVAFEPNGEALWAQIRLRVDDFMRGLFRDGALQGSSLPEACFVRCGRDTTTQVDIDVGTLRLEIGFAPLRPAEFIVLRLQLSTAAPGG